MQNSVICTRITILYEFQPSSVFFFHAKQRLYDQTYKLHGSQTSPVVLCMQNNMISNRNTISAPICGFCIQNSDFWIRITSLYGSQTSPVDLWMQNRVVRSRIMLVYWSQPSFVAFTRRTATFGSELQVSMGPWFHLWFFTFKTAWLARDLLVSMGPSPHLWFLHEKQRLLAQKYKSLWVSNFACWCVNAKQRAKIQNDASPLVPAFICGFVHSKLRL